LIISVANGTDGVGDGGNEDGDDDSDDDDDIDDDGDDDDAVVVDADCCVLNTRVCTASSTAANTESNDDTAALCVASCKVQ
jgi:hypothetical protein